MHDPLQALSAAISATRAYQSSLRAPAEGRPAPPPALPVSSASPAPADPEALGRLTAPTVSRLIARAVRERRLPP